VGLSLGYPKIEPIGKNPLASLPGGKIGSPSSEGGPERGVPEGYRLLVPRLDMEKG